MNPRRLYRSRRDRVLAGVAGGMAEYLDLDPTVVRLLWILSIFFGGFGILVYIVLAFVMPLEPGAAPMPQGPQGGPWWGTAPERPAWAAASPAAHAAPGATASSIPGGASGAWSPDATEGGPAGEAGDETAAGPEPFGGPTGDPANAAWPTPAPTWGEASGAPGPGAAAWPAPGPGAAAWPAPTPEAEGRRSRSALFLGVGLIVFGAIAAVGIAVPGLLGSGLLWAAVVVALGIALLAGALRRDSAVS